MRAVGFLSSGIPSGTPAIAKDEQSVAASAGSLEFMQGYARDVASALTCQRPTGVDSPNRISVARGAGLLKVVRCPFCRDLRRLPFQFPNSTLSVSGVDRFHPPTSDQSPQQAPSVFSDLVPWRLVRKAGTNFLSGFRPWHSSGTNEFR